MDATFWALVSLVLFLALLAYLKVPSMMTKALDDRSDQIRNELSEARRLREEAQRLLSDYQRKRGEAEEEAKAIVAAAEHEAENLAAEAEAKTAEYVARRTAIAEQKIGQAEAHAIAEVKAAAVDVAVAAADRIMSEKVSSEARSELFRNSLSEVRKRMN